MSAAVAEKPNNPPSPPPEEQMAVEQYHKIRLYQNSNPSHPWPNQYVCVNGYQVVLPREADIVIADQILKQLNYAAEGYEHEIYDPANPERRMKVRKRRQDLNHKVIELGISPQEANELRAAGQLVYPAKLPPKALEALEALGKGKTKKGGS